MIMQIVQHQDWEGNNLCTQSEHLPCNGCANPS